MRALRLRNQISASWKWLSSFRKRDWELNDYPVQIRKQQVNDEALPERLKPKPYTASIIKWGVAASGDTREEALLNLRASFQITKEAKKLEGKPLPRPGISVPIEFASQDLVSKNPDLAEDFVRRVLELEWAWISDESSLWDFHSDETNDRFYSKVEVLYGIDVSDIESAKLWEILDRIAANKN